MIMKRNTALKILNPFMFVLFVNQAMTVILLKHISFHTFGLFHKTGGAILLCLIVVHFTLNCDWVKANYFPK
jgi:hypothetical protein